MKDPYGSLWMAKWASFHKRRTIPGGIFTRGLVFIGDPLDWKMPALRKGRGVSART